MTYELPSFKFLKTVKCPITLVHGTNDKVIPIESAEQLCHSASENNVTFEIIDGGSHNDLSNFDAYHQLMDQILD